MSFRFLYIKNALCVFPARCARLVLLEALQRARLVEVVPAARYDRTGEALAANEARKRQAVVVGVRVVLGADVELATLVAALVGGAAARLLRLLFGVPLVLQLPARFVVAAVVQELAIVAVSMQHKKREEKE